MFLGSSRISLAFTLEHCVLHFTTFIALLCAAVIVLWEVENGWKPILKGVLLQYNTVFFDFKNESKERRGGKVNYVWYRKYTWNTFGDFWGQLNCSTEPLPKSFESAERFYIVSCLLFRSQKKHFHRMAEFHYQPQLKVGIHLSQKLHSFKRKILNFLTPRFPTNKLKWTYNKPKIDPKWF